MATHINDNNEFDHRYSFAMKTKPMKSIDSLFVALLPHSQKITLPKNKNYKLNEEKEGKGVILFAEGIATLTYASSGLYSSTVYPPTILGLVQGYSSFYEIPNTLSQEVNLCAETDITLFFVQLQDFVATIDAQNLWHDVARILAHRLMLMIDRECENLKNNSYLKIKNIILEVWSYPEEYRTNINLPSFIQKRTGLSRSRIMKILMDLKKGEYITINSGKLTSVSKLPGAY